MTRTPKAPPQPVTVPASTRQRHNQPLAQTRLASASEAVKSVRRHKTRTPPAADQQQQLRQAGLASFGFAVDTPATNTPTPAPAPAPPPPPPPQQQQQQRRAKRRKRLPREEVEVEVPETQFGQSTQSPQFDTTITTTTTNNNNNDDDAYSSPLFSPPSLSSSPSSDVVGAVGSQASVSSRAAMPPPPVTPKRRKVLEIPDSKSPPVTPFSPWQPSQHQLGMQMLLSPTGRLGGSPVGGRVESGVDTGAAEEVVVGRTGRRLFAAGPKRAREEEEEEEDTPRPRETEKEPPPEAATAGPCAEAPAPAVNRGKTINSSQWWEVEEDAPLSTQVTDTQTQTQSRAGTDIDTQDSIATVLLTDSQKPAARRAQEQGQEQEQEQESGTETFRVDLTYNEPDTEDLEAPEPHDHPARAAAQDESQDSSHSMAAYPPPHPLRDDTLDAAATTTSAKHSLPLPKAPDTVVVDDTASEEDPDPDDEDAPHYKPYHTQQLPSSFWQTNGAYTQLLQQGSQWAPDALRRKYSAAGHPSSSQWAAAPEIVQLPGGAGGPTKDVDVGVEEDVDVDVDAREDEDGDEDEPSQFLPGPGDDGEREGEPPSSPVLPGCPEVPATPTQKVGRGRRRRRRSGEFKLRSIPDDDEDVTIATSQLLPSELMETFPMPPPLSQFSSYGYGDLSFESESETQ